MKKLILIGLVLTLTQPLWALEPRMLDSNLDIEFIDSLGLADPRSHDRFNMLLVAYDSPLPGTENSTASRKYGVDAQGRRRKGLTSRSDIMMVISFDKKRRNIDILSVGRDFEPSPGCWNRSPEWMQSGRRFKGNGKINGAVTLYGRRIMVQCLKSVLAEGLSKTPYVNQYQFDGGLLPIHAIYEVERGKDADSSVIGKLNDAVFSEFLTTISLAWTYSGSMRTMVNIGGRYKLIFNGLKRRDYAVAGSYQRAFNNAKFVADAMGWAAPGVQSYKDEGYDFLDLNIFSPIDQIMGASHSLSELNSLLSYYPRGREQAVDNMFRYGAFIENPGTGAASKTNPFGDSDPVSPVRVIQFGGNLNSYAVYQNGILNFSGVRSNDFLRGLKVRPVFHKPGESVPLCPECHVQPQLPSGGWGLPYFDELP